MSPPRQHLPNQEFHSIRRTHDRTYFFAPTRESVWTQEYAFAWGHLKSEVVTSVEIVMLNHRHGYQLDAQGRRADFHERYHGLLARYTNHLLGRKGSLWDNQQPTEIVVLRDAERPENYEFEVDYDDEVDDELRNFWDKLGLDVVDRTVLYILMNPIKANLVETLADYPGFKITPDDWGKERTVRRPPWLGNSYPAEITYTPQPPAKWEGTPLYLVKRYYKKLIKKAERFYKKRRRKAGKGVMGAEALIRQDPFARPNSPEAPIRRQPKFAGASRLRVKAIKAYSVFVENHRCSRLRFKGGHRTVSFPAGTIQLRKLAAVRCRAHPLPDENPMP